jgi:hypothetical protein
MYKDIAGWHAAQGRKGGLATAAKQSASQLQERSRKMNKAKKVKARKNVEWLRAWLEKDKSAKA